MEKVEIVLRQIITLVFLLICGYLIHGCMEKEYELQKAKYEINR